MLAKAEKYGDWGLDKGLLVMLHGCLRRINSVRSAKGPHEREVAKLRICDEEKSKALSTKIGRRREVQGAQETESTLKPSNKSRNEAPRWVSQGPNFLTRIVKRPTAHPSKKSVRISVIIADTPPFLDNVPAANCDTYCVVDVWLH